MTYMDRQNAVAAKRVSKKMELILKVLKSIASEHFILSEAYIVWRMYELMCDPQVFSDTLLEANYKRFGRSDISRARALPTDNQIVSSLNSDSQRMNIREL